MPSSHRLIASLAALALALVLAACGGGSEESSSEVPEGAVVLVGDTEVAKAEYDQLLAQARATFKERKQPFPEAGSQEYEQLKQAIVRSLVEEAQFAIGAEELGVEVTDEEVEKRLDELKEQYFQGDEKKYEDELKKQGVSDAQVRDDLRSRILSEKIFKEVTGDVNVTDAEVKKYYEDNKEAQFGTPASREVRHILVKTRARADQLYDQLQGGASFAKLAGQYSQDPSSKDQGGRLTAQKGATVAPFDRTAFALETGEISRPVKTRFGYHVIEALEDVQKASSRPLASVENEIRQTLLGDKQNQAMTKWVDDLKKRLDGDVAYAVGFQPPDPDTTTESGTTTTG